MYTGKNNIYRVQYYTQYEASTGALSNKEGLLYCMCWIKGSQVSYYKSTFTEPLAHPGGCRWCLIGGAMWAQSYGMSRNLTTEKYGSEKHGKEGAGHFWCRREKDHTQIDKHETMSFQANASIAIIFE